MKTEPFFFEQSPIGPCQSDHLGSPVGVARVEPSQSYAGVGNLLQRYIKDADDAAWKEIRDKIDYTYEGLNIALSALKAETGFGPEIKNRMGSNIPLLSTGAGSLLRKPMTSSDGPPIVL
jgi:hypothetical protein